MKPRRMARAAALSLLLALLAGPAAAQDLPGRARGWQAEWPDTDFSQRAVDLKEIISGGPPKDGIPPIDAPAFVPMAEAAGWLGEDEPVVALQHGDEAKAYPLQILIWHEIVNDAIGGVPVSVTFCPLCNSALVFDRRVDGRVLDFGTTGKLRFSDLVMWDRQTESWWQQITGRAIVGELTGTELEILPAPLVSFRTFRDNFPQGRVLSRDTGFNRNYGANPYRRYDSPDNERPFLFSGEPDPRVPAMERVVNVQVGDEAKAYPYSELQRAGGVINDVLGGEPIVVFFEAETRSALDDARIASSRQVGNGVAYKRNTLERTLVFFKGEDGAFYDQQTRTRWTMFGEAAAGLLKDNSLEPVDSGNHFAFAWFAFRPDSEVYRPGQGGSARR